MRKCCIHCRYFVSHISVGRRMEALHQGGECRYNPPTSHGGAFALGTFPVVLISDWCRQFSPHEGLDDEANDGTRMMS